MRCPRLLLLCLLILSALFSFSQAVSRDPARAIKAFKRANLYYNKSRNEGTTAGLTELQESTYKMEALRAFVAADSLIDIVPLHLDSIQLIVALRAGELAHYFDSLSLALHYYLKAIDIQRQLSGTPDSLVFHCYIFAGQIYFRRIRLDDAARSFQKAEEIQERYKTKLTEAERLYNSFGVLYFQQGDYIQASNYFRKAAQLLNPDNEFFNDFYVNFNINYATALFKLEKYDEAEEILRRLLRFRLHLNEILNNIGLIELAKGNSAKALQDFQKVQYGNALDIGLENDKAGCWLAMKQFDSCEAHLKRASLNNIFYNGNNPGFDRGLTLKIYGDLKISLKQYQEAAQYFQDALIQFYPAFKDKDVRSNPKQFSGVFSYINVFKTLVGKAAAFHSLYLSSANSGWARKELETFMTAFDLLDYIDRVYESDEARLFLEKSRYLIHEKPIDLCFELYSKTQDRIFLEKAYEIDQRTKATLLALKKEENQVLQTGSGIQPEVLVLKKEITRLSISAETIHNPVIFDSISGKIHELEISLNKAQQSVENNYASHRMAVPTIESLQHNLLDEKTQVLSYHLSGSKLSVFSITNKTFKARQEDFYPAFKTDLDKLISRLHGQMNNNFSSGQLGRLSAFLLKDLNVLKSQTLIIIPDDELNFLPFESLLLNNKFLIEQASVQYQYSTTLLKPEKGNFSRASIVAFAPFSASGYRDTLYKFAPLPFSLEEANAAGGSLFAGSLATKQNFLNNLNKTDIIHLATHAVAGDTSGRSSFIAFAPWGRPDIDYLLYSREIYNLSMQTNKLIILSACETGYGTLVKGEGVMSLSRAFAYAGCPNIITSLWKADDEATSYILRQVHANLRNGLPVAEAVQEAKKTYLSDKTINPRRKDPIFWANFIFVGNYSAADDPWKWYVFASIALTVLLALLLAKRIKSNPKPGRLRD